MKKEVLVLGVTLLLLSGCTSKDQLIKPAQTTDTRTTVEIDRRLLQECSSLSNLPNNPTPSDVLLQHTEDVKVFLECSDRHSALVKVVRKAFNLVD